MINWDKMKKYIILLISTVILLFCISLTQNQINTIKVKENLIDSTPVENAPPVVAFTTVALGCFRGLLADLLWLRSTALQEKGKYFEMVQLASWITKLQPKFTGGTAFLAWNMAYNISVTCSSPEDRWKWVQRGIELIRDDALQYNTADPVLYKELGWIYQHKIGNMMDDAHQYYKKQMALELVKVFGERPDWEKMAAAPSTLDELYKIYPEEDITKNIRDAGFTEFSDFKSAFRKNGKFPERYSKQTIDRKMKEALEFFLRKEWLLTKYKLSPERILKINNKYGELEWRLPEAHAIYWATVGLEKDSTSIECGRMITQALKDAFMGGRLLIISDDNSSKINTIPNINVVDAVHKSYLDAYKKYKSSTFKSAMFNFMIDATVTLYSFGAYTKAEEYLKMLREENGSDKYDVSLDQFVLKEFAEDVRDATVKQANMVVNGLLYRSAALLAWGNVKGFEGHLRFAKYVHGVYHKAHKSTDVRTGLASFEKMKNEMFLNCMKHFPPLLRKNFEFQLKVVGIELKEPIKKLKNK